MKLPEIFQGKSSPPDQLFPVGFTPRTPQWNELTAQNLDIWDERCQFLWDYEKGATGYISICKQNPLMSTIRASQHRHISGQQCWGGYRRERWEWRFGLPHLLLLSAIWTLTVILTATFTAEDDYQDNEIPNWVPSRLTKKDFAADTRLLLTDETHPDTLLPWTVETLADCCPKHYPQLWMLLSRSSSSSAAAAAALLSMLVLMLRCPDCWHQWNEWGHLNPLGLGSASVQPFTS